jgi:hypothetical protein
MPATSTPQLRGRPVMKVDTAAAAARCMSLSKRLAHARITRELSAGSRHEGLHRNVKESCFMPD